MRSTFATSEAITSVLKDAQATIPTTPFAISSDIVINNYQPGDFRIDGVSNDDGVYIYFDKTNFNSSDGGGNSHGHKPVLNIDIYVSEGATRAQSGAITYSVEVANNRLKNICGQLTDAIWHTEFLRLVNTKLESNTNISEKVRCSVINITTAEKMGVLRLTESSKTIAVFQFKIEINISEITGTNAGIALDGTNDRISAYRVEADYE